MSEALSITGPSAGGAGVSSATFTLTLTGGTFNGAVDVIVDTGNTSDMISLAGGNPTPSPATNTPSTGTTLTFTVVPSPTYYLPRVITLTTAGDSPKWGLPAPFVFSINNRSCSITLLTARQTVRQYARYGGSSTMYPDAQVDFALSQAADMLVREANILQRIDQFVVAVGTNTISGVPLYFRPDRMISAYLTGSNVIVTTAYPSGYSPDFGIGYQLVPSVYYLNASLNLKTYENVLNETLAFPQVVGQPRDIAFDTRSGTGIVYPQANDNFTVNLRWNDIFTPFLAGSQGAWSSATTYEVGDLVSDSGTAYQCLQVTTNNEPPNTTYWTALGATAIANPQSLTFNIVDDYMRTVITVGAPAILMQAEPEHQVMAQAKMTQYKEYCDLMRAKGDLGENTAEMSMPMRGGLGWGYNGPYGSAGGW